MSATNFFPDLAIPGTNEPEASASQKWAAFRAHEEWWRDYNERRSQMLLSRGNVDFAWNSYQRYLAASRRLENWR